MQGMGFNTLGTLRADVDALFEAILARPEAAVHCSNNKAGLFLSADDVKQRFRRLSRFNPDIPLAQGSIVTSFLFTSGKGNFTSTFGDGDGWDWQFCTEQFMPSSRDGERDMFWKQPWNESEQIARCEKRWGVTPRVGWATTQFGGRRLSDASRIAWSNGDLDPWSRLGVNANVSDSLVAVRLVPIRPRTRCERRSLRSWTFPVVDRSSPALHFQRTFDRVGPFQPPFRLMRRVARFVVRFPFAAARITWTSCGATLTTSRA